MKVILAKSQTKIWKLNLSLRWQVRRAAAIKCCASMLQFRLLGWLILKDVLSGSVPFRDCIHGDLSDLHDAICCDLMGLIVCYNNENSASHVRSEFGKYVCCGGWIQIGRRFIKYHY